MTLLKHSQDQPQVSMGGTAQVCAPPEDHSWEPYLGISFPRSTPWVCVTICMLQVREPRLRGMRGLALAPHHWGGGWGWWNPGQPTSTAHSLSSSSLSPLDTRLFLKAHAKPKHTLSRVAHTLGWGQISPPSFRSVISSSDGVLGKMLPRWKVTWWGADTQIFRVPHPPHTHSHWLPLFTPSHPFKISACASFLTN